MQLSSQARKAMAAGLAMSTILWASLGLVPSFASAAVHSDGCVVLSGGVVWLITGGTRRGFTSAEVFQSSGYNFSEVVGATPEDVALPVGPIMTYADGTLVMDPSLSPLVYLVTGGQKRGFVSGAVFTGLGYSFSNIQTAPANTFNDLPTGANLDSTTIAHPAGTLVISNGTLWWMSASGRMGFPSMAVFDSYGLMLTHAAAANAADLALPDQGPVVMRAVCTGGGTTVPSGSVSVSLATDNPAANTVVAGQSTADLAHFNFTGSGAVTQLTLARLGVSANTTLANVYLYNGNLRITDASSVNSNGQIVFNNASGLFNAPASVSVRADIASGVSGQTVGVGVVSGMSGTASIAGVPQGNLFTVANPGNLATANFTNSITPASGSVNAGSLNSTVWSAPLAIAQRNVWLKTAMFRVIGSANSDALQNWILYIDGNQVATASALQSVNGSNYAVFNPVSPFSVQTGSHTLEVRADIVKGSGRTVTVSLQNAADIQLTDSNFNVNVTPTLASATFSPMAAGQLSISNGIVSVQLDPTFNSVSTVAGGATNVPLAKFNLTSYGEDVQISTLVVTFAGTDIGTNGLNNVALYANGAQVGSTQQILTTGTTATFSLGSSLIVPAGTTTNLSVQSDTIANTGNTPLTSGTLQVSLAASGANVSNSTGRSSQNTLSVPTATVTANTMTVGAGGLTVAKNSAYTNQTLGPNTTAQRIGSFTLQAGSSEGIRISNLAVGLTCDGTNLLGSSTCTTSITGAPSPTITNFSNLKVSVNGGTPSSPVSAQTSNNFSQNFTIAVNGTATVDVWADLGSYTNTVPLLDVTLGVTGNGVVSNTSASASGVIGQAITLQAGTLSAPTFTTASSSPSMFVATAGSGNTGGSLNSFNLAATSGAVNVSELKFVVNDATAGTVPTSGVVSSIMVGSTSAPVITPSTTTLGASIASTGATSVTVASGTNFSPGSVFTVDSEDIQVTAVSGTTLTVTRGVDSTTAATHSSGATVNIHGMADLNGLNLAVPNGAGGIYINASPTYTIVGPTGLTAADTTSKIALTFNKYTSGSSTTSAAVTPVQANAMDSVGSKPNLAVTSTNNAGLVIGENHVFDLTVTPDAKGNVQLNTIVFTLSSSGVTSPVFSVPRLAVGSTTITNSSCSGTTTVTCNLPSGYVLTAGTPQTLSLFVTLAGTLGSGGTSSITSVLAASTNFSWGDTAGNGTTITSTTNTSYLNNYPTQTWSVHN
jgi:hypothetical protein